MRFLKTHRWSVLAGVLAMACLAAMPSITSAVTSASGYTIIGWNDLGMHCMDRDYSVFSLLPPYNSIRAQIVDSSGKLVKDATASGLTVTYEPVADAAGLINTTSVGKSNFWQYAKPLFGLPANLAPDAGLVPGFNMPGAAGRRVNMQWDASFNGFHATGIPITPLADKPAGASAYPVNTYPMMRLSVLNAAKTVLASTNIVLPVSSEMTCSQCHASNNGSNAARPSSGWDYYYSTSTHTDADLDIDVRLNILKLHDDRNRTDAGNPAAPFTANYQRVLAAFGYSPNGLYSGVKVDKRPVLCASCHASVALSAKGDSAVPALTTAMHTRHAGAWDATSNSTLGNAANRNACYRCHPGSETRCLRGAMGDAIAFDGSMQMQCQNCHGGMSAVGTKTRTGWLDEPGCGSCHTGTAVKNSGAIRYTSVFDGTGARRTPADATFATNANAPTAPYSLYRFSKGHGGLQCEACHGSTHAEYPSSHANDNAQSVALQGHKGLIGDCTACHVKVPTTLLGGPHGMHAVDASWVSRHGDAVEKTGSGACQACHGGDSRGTVLSRTFGDRTFSTKFGTKTFWKGFQVSCYACHNGPSNDNATSNKPPVATSLASVLVARNTAKSFALSATDANKNALTLRVVSQPAHGRVGLSGTTATYFPDTGFTGADTFTFAAWDGYTNSNLASVNVKVQ